MDKIGRRQLLGCLISSPLLPYLPKIGEPKEKIPEVYNVKTLILSMDYFRYKGEYVSSIYTCIKSYYRDIDIEKFQKLIRVAAIPNWIDLVKIKQLSKDRISVYFITKDDNEWPSCQNFIME